MITEEKKKEAFSIVLEELMKCELFKGNYDAKNGNNHFMNGVACVMENIAYHVSDNVGDTFSDMFLNNLILSEEKIK